LHAEPIVEIAGFSYYTRMTPTEIRALVIDDNQDVRDSMVMVLELMGCYAMALSSAEEALPFLTEEQPIDAPIHIAFVDVSLLGMSGYELARIVRSKHVPRKAMLIAMTGWGAERDRERALSEGFDAHVVKPLDMTRLRSLLDAVRPR
jgi:CheY-like chemotaxis protein